MTTPVTRHTHTQLCRYTQYSYCKSWYSAIMWKEQRRGQPRVKLRSENIKDLLLHRHTQTQTHTRTSMELTQWMHTAGLVLHRGLTTSKIPHIHTDTHILYLTYSRSPTHTLHGTTIKPSQGMQQDQYHLLAPTKLHTRVYTHTHTHKLLLVPTKLQPAAQHTNKGHGSGPGPDERQRARDGFSSFDKNKNQTGKVKRR